MNQYSTLHKKRHQKTSLAVNLGLASNIFLAALKTSVGVFGHSPALLADGINSTSDVVYYLVVVVFMRLARKPPDEEHPYGHSQLESIASLVVGAFVVATGIAIFWNSVNNVYELFIGEIVFQGAAWGALWIALFTVLLKIILNVFTKRLAEQTENPALLALAHDHRNDMLSASGVAIGILLGRLGYTWADPLVGALVALLVLRTGMEILRQSSAELMDAVPSRALAQQITHLLSDIPQVRQVEEIHAHRFGPYLVINLTIGVDGSLSVRQGDRIASMVENAIYGSIDLVRHVYVHYHPVEPAYTREVDQSEAGLPSLEVRLE